MKTFNYSLVRIIFALIIGLVLVLMPDAAANYLVMTIGFLFLVPGIISIIGYLSTKRAEGVSVRFPIEAVGSLLFGLWLIITPDFFSEILMYVLGFVLLMGGVWQLSSLFNARKWAKVPMAFYIVPTLILLTGLFVVANPLDARDTIFIVIGVACLIFSIAELINWFKFTRKRPIEVIEIKDETIVTPDKTED